MKNKTILNPSGQNINEVPVVNFTLKKELKSTNLGSDFNPKINIDNFLQAFEIHYRKLLRPIYLIILLLC